jgi:hypothetical protein
MVLGEETELIEENQWNVQEVVETGEEIAVDHYNTVFHSDSVHPGYVFKVFYRTPASEVRENISRTDPSKFPYSDVVNADLSEFDFEEDATVVAQEKSDYSILDATDNYHEIEQIYSDLMAAMDGITSSGLIHKTSGNLSELKIEEFHYYQDDIMYVDFEDNNAFINFPEDYHPDDGIDRLTNMIGKNYKLLAHQAAEEFEDDLEDIKEKFIRESSHLRSSGEVKITDNLIDFPFR